ncbi:MAG: hypothetical protein CMH83_13500 [Nocardioides sp.]|nr:hypothetical protein [Nocardioides sp.]
MEIAPKQRRARSRLRRHHVAVVLATFATWCAVMLLVPIGLGIDVHVQTGDDQVLSRGSLSVVRSLPVSDLELGDVVLVTTGPAEVTDLGADLQVATGDGLAMPLAGPAAVSSVDTVVWSAPVVAWPVAWAGPAADVLARIGFAVDLTLLTLLLGWYAGRRRRRRVAAAVQAVAGAAASITPAPSRGASHVARDVPGTAARSAGSGTRHAHAWRF